MKIKLKKYKTLEKEGLVQHKDVHGISKETWMRMARRKSYKVRYMDGGTYTIRYNYCKWFVKDWAIIKL